MKRIAFSIILALGIHGLLLNSDFKIPGSSGGPAVIADRLTVVMIPATLERTPTDPGPLPAIKPLPAILPPPAPALLTRAAVPENLSDPQEGAPDLTPAPSIHQPKPKNSLKALTKVLRRSQPKSESAVQPEAPAQLQASTPSADPAAVDPSILPSAQAAQSPKRLTTVAAVHKSSGFLPDRPAIPLLKQNPPPLYPDSARRRGYHGLVVLKVLVGANGGVEAVEIHQTCGYEILDRTALAAVRLWLFEPGIQGGEKIKMWVKVPVRFELK